MHDYIDGELKEMDECLAAEHCAECEACAREVRSLRRTRELTARYGVEYAPEGLEIALRQKISAEHRFSSRPKKTHSVTHASKNRLSIPKWAALAATFTLVVLAGAYFNLFHFGSGGGQLAQKAVSDQKIKTSMGVSKELREAASGKDKLAEMKMNEAAAVRNRDVASAATVAGRNIAGSNVTTVSTSPESSPAAAGGGRLSYAIVPQPVPTEAVAPAHTGVGAGITAEAKAAEQAIEQYDKKYEIAMTHDEAGIMTNQHFYASSIETGKSLGVSQPPAVVPEPSIARASTGASKSVTPELVGYVNDRREERYAVLGTQVPFATVIEPEEMSFVVMKESAKRDVPSAQAKGKVRSVTVARATDVVTSKNPNADALKCEKIIQDFSKVNDGVARWQRIGNRFVIRGPYKVMNPLRIKLAEEFTATGAKAKKDITVASASTPVASAAEAEKKTPEGSADINPDMPAVLEILVVPDQTPPK